MRDIPTGEETEEKMNMENSKKGFLTAQAVEKINEILSRDKEAVLSYRRNKNELIIMEQTAAVKDKIIITSE